MPESFAASARTVAAMALRLRVVASAVRKIGAALDGTGGQGAIPDIAEANGIAVVLELERPCAGKDR